MGEGKGRRKGGARLKTFPRGGGRSPLFAISLFLRGVTFSFSFIRLFIGFINEVQYSPEIAAESQVLRDMENFEEKKTNYRGRSSQRARMTGGREERKENEAEFTTISAISTETRPCEFRYFVVVLLSPGGNFRGG